MNLKLNFTIKMWILVAVLVLSLISIFGLPPKILEKGVVIESMPQNSTAFQQGLRQGQIITQIDGNEISNIQDFTEVMQNKFKTGEKIKTTIKTKESEVILYTNKTPEIVVSEIPSTTLKLGLDLIGGSRALVKAENKTLSQSEVQDLVDITQNRLNEFGLTDLKVTTVSDLSGENYMLIQIAGATPEDLREMISKQGKFEAKIGNETVFIGGEKDIHSVCRGDPQCAGIENCQEADDGSYYCNFRFAVYLSEIAAKRHANITENISVNVTGQDNYLSKNLDLYLDDSLVDSLRISEDLKGRETTQISISGSGQGKTREEAFDDAEESMNKLQTVLITGSLPYKLEIVKLDTISPFLGKEFERTIFIAAIASLAAISLIVFFRYKKPKASIALIFISISEIIIILGIASLIEWNLDLPSIAGILVAIGTGLDDLIIMVDESKQGELSLKQKLKRAFAIILGAYFTTAIAMLPLLWAGAGLLKGFAVTTLIGISVGVFITRPVFGDILKKTEKK